ncbi:MAG: LacI family DNA-binding transcriptional regulator [Pseudomonadota bacterium]
MSDHALPTLADVAQKAGVSTATVSRCLNSPDRVVEETRKRVMAAVRELGYAPNFGAQALAAKQTNTVGAVIPTMENAVFARGLQAFQQELGRHGKTLLVASSSYDAALEDEQIRALVARGADALLLIGYDRSRELYEFLDKRGVPTLVSWSCSETEARAAMGFDNRLSMLRLAREVLKLGHRHIACLSAPLSTNDRARGRVQGIRNALAEFGLPPNTLPVFETPYGIDTGTAAFKALVEKHPGTTAIMCVNDVLALGALRGARERGLSVPNDISVTGFDDIEIALLAEPPLTTVHVPHRDMGQRAARMLLDMLRDGTKGARVALPTEIMMRGSLGPVPGAPR